jgi:hypothetical protein
MCVSDALRFPRPKFLKKIYENKSSSSTRLTQFNGNRPCLFSDNFHAHWRDRYDSDLNLGRRLDRCWDGLLRRPESLPRLPARQ